jgi:hypothetical protein
MRVGQMRLDDRTEGGRREPSISACDSFGFC